MIENYNKKKDDQLYPKTWSVTECTSDEQPTDAYGDIRFIDAKGNIAKVNRDFNHFNHLKKCEFSKKCVLFFSSYEYIMGLERKTYMIF